MKTSPDVEHPETQFKVKVGIASDHAGFELKKFLVDKLLKSGYDVFDFGDSVYEQEDDYPDYVFPLAAAVSTGRISRGLAICGSGVGACIAANKTPDVRASLINEKFSARQGVEDDDMNVICLGGKTISHPLAWELVTIFLNARFNNAKRHIRRLQKIRTYEMALNRNDG